MTNPPTDDRDPTGDVPIAQLQPLLDDPTLTFEDIGVYAHIRSRELSGGGSYEPGTHRSVVDELGPLNALTQGGYLRETPFGYRTT